MTSIRVNDLEPPFKKVKQEQEEPEESGVTMNDLPELPFEKILGYLSLEERIKVRAVSRRWWQTIDSFRVQSLCYSDLPIDHIYKKAQLISGAFARNFINSTRIESFLQLFGQPILSRLKHLRLCSLDLRLNPEKVKSFAKTLNSFDQLEELDIFNFEIRAECGFYPRIDLELNLPMLTSIQLKSVVGYEAVILNAPRLEKVKHWPCDILFLDFVHGESVERLIIWKFCLINMKKLKNLKALYLPPLQAGINSTFLSRYPQLKEIHVDSEKEVSDLFEQKQRYGRSDLMIFFRGLLLNGPADPAIHSAPETFRKEYVRFLIANHSRLADEIPFHSYYLGHHRAIEGVVPALEIDVLKRFTDLSLITVDEPVQDVERFLGLLNNLRDNIAKLEFRCSQPQELFDRLPEHCAVQILIIHFSEAGAPAALDFLLRLKSLLDLDLGFSIDLELVPKVFEELPFISAFHFRYLENPVTIQVDHPKLNFNVSVDFIKRKIVSDVNAAVQFIIENTTE